MLSRLALLMFGTVYLNTFPLHFPWLSSGPILRPIFSPSLI